MLETSRISRIGMMADTSTFSEDWLVERIGKITSSPIYKLCTKEGFGKEGMNYIRTRVFEKIAKISSDRQISTPDTINGLVEEGNAIRLFKKNNNIDKDHLVVQKLIHGKDSAFACTPDAIWLQSVVLPTDKNEQGYNVITIESKSFGAERHIMCAECITPEDVLIADPKTYWQVLDQMNVVESLYGRLIYFNQAMPEDKGGYREIPFRRTGRSLEEVDGSGTGTGRCHGEWRMECQAELHLP